MHQLLFFTTKMFPREKKYLSGHSVERFMPRAVVFASEKSYQRPFGVVLDHAGGCDKLIEIIPAQHRIHIVAGVDDEAVVFDPSMSEGLLLQWMHDEPVT